MYCVVLTLPMGTTSIPSGVVIIFYSYGRSAYLLISSLLCVHLGVLSLEGIFLDGDVHRLNVGGNSCPSANVVVVGSNDQIDIGNVGPVERVDGILVKGCASAIGD